MHERKKNGGRTKKTNLTLKLLYLLLISLLAVNFSIAKYKTTYSASATANAASWTFKINNNAEQTFSVDLANTVVASSLYDQTKNVIAPGAEGKFSVNIDCTGSDVAMDYIISIEKDSLSNIPDSIIFYTLNGTEKTLLAGNSQSNINNIEGTITLDEINETPIKTIDIYWQWKLKYNVEESSYQGNSFYVNLNIIGKQHLS